MRYKAELQWTVLSLSAVLRSPSRNCADSEASADPESQIAAWDLDDVRGAQRDAEQGGQGKGQRQHGLHNGLHAFGRFAVRVLVHGGKREGLAEALEYVDRDLGGHVDAVGDQSSVRGGTVARVRVSRAGAVDPTLGTGRECHGGDLEGEAEGHACDGRKGDPEVAEEG
ncbi:hypothetical protein MMC27_008114 [Xylographa pallens]|nr:hypothetical protein [Xylographa pallens]